MPDMVPLPGGRFRMGSDRHYPEEAPAHEAVVGPFRIDRTLVTNRRFAAFVMATSYLTVAEIAPDPADYPGAPSELLVPGSLVFTPTAGPVRLDDWNQWWRWVPGADWRHPTGPDSSLDGLWDHPVVQVAAADAEAYAAWAGRRLPTEAEWEYAARGGGGDSEFAWGADLEPGGRHMANVWQGAFPHGNSAADGFVRTSPVGHYPANGFGLLDMIGNVWEWTADWYADRHSIAADGCCGGHGGPKIRAEESHDPAMPDIPIPRRVLKGGSHLCSPLYCRRYRPAARHPQAVDSATSHIGFRCAADA